MDLNSVDVWVSMCWAGFWLGKFVMAVLIVVYVIMSEFIGYVTVLKGLRY